MSTLAKEYHHGDLRRALLEEGIKLLDEKGPDELSMRELARRTGVSVMAPYRHYPDKSSLLAAIATHGFLNLAHRINSIDPAGKPSQSSLLQAGIAYVRFALEQPAMFRLMFGGNWPDAQYPDLSDARASAFDSLVQNIRSEVAPDERIPYAHGCWSLVHGLALLLLDGMLRAPDGMELDQWLTQVITITISGYSPQ